MKPVLGIIRVLFLTGLVTTFSCSEKEEVPLPPNRPPVARAGADQSLMLPSCSETLTDLVLDGSASTDPDAGDRIKYSWYALPPAGSYNLVNADEPKAKVRDLCPGNYKFVLKVWDSWGLTSWDTVAVNVSGAVDTYDLDLAFASKYTFTDNNTDCSSWDDPVCPNDLVAIRGRGSWQSTDDLEISIFEWSDTAALANAAEPAQISIGVILGKPAFVFGTQTFNLKKLVQQGGGSFTGSVVLISGSARYCDADGFSKLPPLVLTGELNTATKSVNLRVKGKVMF